jgi:NADPH-dependent ferric siderophore reductase
MDIPTYRAAVVRTSWVSRRMRRVTLGGHGLVGFTSSGLPDERIRLLLPPPGRRHVDGQPTRRTFTVRRFDPDAVELDVDFALHDGPAAAWSLNAREHDEIGVSGPTGGYEPGVWPGHHLLAGDEAALPALATILERLPADASAHVLVEVSDPSAEVTIDSRAEVSLTWLHRNGSSMPAGGLLVRAAHAFDWSRSQVQVWAAGEALAMRAMRRLVRDEVGLPRHRYQVVGYWRDRLTEDEAIEAHFRAQDAARASGASDDEVDDAGLY